MRSNAEILFLDTPQGKLCYRKTGRGPRALIALHGFTQSGASFNQLGLARREEYTVYALDLPFHGKSAWKRSGYTAAQITSIIRGIMEKEGIGRFGAIGYSMGARLWMSLLPHFQAEMEALYLLAPDGFSTRWLSMAERQPLFLRRLLGSMVARPGWALRLAGKLYRWKLIDGFLLRYLEHHLPGRRRRARLLNTWYAMAHFPMNGKRARRLLKQSGIPVKVLLGKQDQLIPATLVREMLAGLDNVSVTLLDTGHIFSMRHVAKYI